MGILRVASLGLAVLLGTTGWIVLSAAPGMVTTGSMDTDALGQARGAGMSTTMSRDEKVANAMSAAPTSIAAQAAILDWPASDGAEPAVLRAGTNGWTCLPAMPSTQGNDPMCLDATWMQWVQAYMAKTAPKLSSVGIGYMIAPGGAWGSNVDPFATKQTADNQWHLHPPHMMIVVPDARSLEGLPTDPGNGGPYVMFKGTPYAHIMAPVTGVDHGAMMMK